MNKQKQYHLEIKPPIPADYPRGFTPDEFTTSPFARRFSDRRDALLHHYAGNSALGSFKAPFYELARLAVNQPVYIEIFTAALNYVSSRSDCADQILHSIIRLQYQFSAHQILEDQQVGSLAHQIRATLLNFKYWPDEPGSDLMSYWTENHQILFAAAAFLAGQLYPAETFTNSGLTGWQQMQNARERIYRWLGLRFRTGFSQWFADQTYDDALTALINLVDFCEDEDLRLRAEMVVDLLIYDLALNHFHGSLSAPFVSSPTDSTDPDQDQTLSDTLKLLFGVGRFAQTNNMSAVLFALSPRYRFPAVLYQIANESKNTEITNRQRMGFRIEDRAQLGLGDQDFEDGMVYLSMGGEFQPPIAALTVELLDTYQGWRHTAFRIGLRKRRLLRLAQKLRLLHPLVSLFTNNFGLNYLPAANLYSFRTPDYQLSSVQDYRKGCIASARHLWQATLGSTALCFSSYSDHRAGAGSIEITDIGRLPRIAQIKNVAILVYRLDPVSISITTKDQNFVYGWFPQPEFDHVEECAGWIFAHLGNGYLALRPGQRYLWRTEPGEITAKRILSPGKINIWICEMGRRETDGDFKDFIERITSARLEYNGLNVSYDSPSQGRLQFGWTGPLLQQGLPVSLAAFPRYDTPYTRADYPAVEIEIRQQADRLNLRWQDARRTVNRFAR